MPPMEEVLWLEEFLHQVIRIQDFSFDVLRSPFPWLEMPYCLDGQNSFIGNGNSVPSSRNQQYQSHMMGLNNPRPMSGMNTCSGCMNRTYPNARPGEEEMVFIVMEMRAWMA